jgi:hypothetical protein
MSLPAFSQTDTTVVVLPAETARLVIKDLVTLDNLRLQLEATQNKVDALELRYTTLDSIRTIRETQIANYEQIIGDKDKIIQETEKFADNLQKDLNGEKIKKNIYKYGNIASAGLLILSLVLK